MCVCVPARLCRLAAGREALAGPAEGGGGGKCGSDSAAPANTCKQLRAHNGKYRWGTAGAAPSRRRLHQTAGCQEPARPRHRSGPRSQSPPPPPHPPFFPYILVLRSHPRLPEMKAERIAAPASCWGLGGGGVGQKCVPLVRPSPPGWGEGGVGGGGALFLAFYFKN